MAKKTVPTNRNRKLEKLFIRLIFFAPEGKFFAEWGENDFPFWTLLSKVMTLGSG
jgi:hypothetical protein